MWVAFAPPDARHTAFSGELIRLLDESEPSGPAQLSLAYPHRRLDEVLTRRWGTAPRVQITGHGGDLVLAANPGYHQPRQDEGSAVTVPPDAEAPYIGLRSYGRHNSGLFFGRGKLVDELVGRLRGRLWQPGPLTVVGPSGSGKSSLLRAGLLPAITQGALGVPGSAGWPTPVVPPGGAPLDQLLSALSRLGQPPDNGPTAADRGREITHDHVFRDPGLLVQAVRAAVARVSGRRAGPNSSAVADRLVPVVDQFEELFT
ncbi:ATP-binding protein, partial [Streptomyces malaysiense]|uniref:ATP-binding protein n=1 Tax=Streptomyces malaysiense TaxID=1428626 RepID=UPI0011606D8D